MRSALTDADQDAGLREAWAYLTPHQMTHGPVILDGPKMRAAIATLRTERDQLAADLRERDAEIAVLRSLLRDVADEADIAAALAQPDPRLEPETERGGDGG